MLTPEDHTKLLRSFEVDRLLKPLASGACWVCGDEATDQCEAPGCARWVCLAHVIIEAQWWDVQGFDGVDIRCPTHRQISFAMRDLDRGRYLPPPPLVGGARNLSLL